MKLSNKLLNELRVIEKWKKIKNIKITTEYMKICVVQKNQFWETSIPKYVIFLKKVSNNSNLINLEKQRQPKLKGKNTKI